MSVIFVWPQPCLAVAFVGSSAATAAAPSACHRIADVLTCRPTDIGAQPAAIAGATDWFCKRTPRAAAWLIRRAVDKPRAPCLSAIVTVCVCNLGLILAGPGEQAAGLTIHRRQLMRATCLICREPYAPRPPCRYRIFAQCSVSAASCLAACSGRLACGGRSPSLSRQAAWSTSSPAHAFGDRWDVAGRVVAVSLKWMLQRRRCIELLQHNTLARCAVRAFQPSLAARHTSLKMRTRLGLTAPGKLSTSGSQLRLLRSKSCGGCETGMSSDRHALQLP